MYAASAARLVDRAIIGENGLLLLAGTPGSGRSHTLWGKGGASPLHHYHRHLHPEQDGILPQALADLELRWRGGKNNPFYSSSSSPPSSASSTAVVRFCTVELLGGGAGRGGGRGGVGDGGEAATIRDLLGGVDKTLGGAGCCGGCGRYSRGGIQGACCRTPPGNGRRGTPHDSSCNGGNNKRESLSPARRALSSAKKGLLAAMTPSSSSPSRSSSYDKKSGIGVRRGMGRGRARGARIRRADNSAPAASLLLASRVLAGVTELTAQSVDEALVLIREVS